MNRLADETIQACPHGCHGEVANTDCPQHGRPPANVSPTPGQRWEFLLSDGWQQATIRADGGLSWANGGESLRIAGAWNLRMIAAWAFNGKAHCLDSNPTPASPAPSTPLPDQQMGAGAPSEGYVPCRDNCGRWNHADIDRCWACYYANCPEMRGHEYPKELEAKYPDWTPPASAPPPAEPLKNCPHALLVGLCPLCEPERAAEFVAERRARVSSEWSAAVNAALETRAEERAERAVELGRELNTVLGEDLFGRAVRT